MIKYILLGFTLFATTFGAPVFAHAQTTAQGQPQSQNTAPDEDDEAYDDYDYALDLLDAASITNENCKGVLEPVYYDGFKVILRVAMGDLGATDEDVQKFEATSVEMADYICPDKSACWRSATGLPETATPEEGRAKCLDMMTNIIRELSDIFDPPASATAQ